MNAIKLHFYVGSDDGTTACDYRGDKKIGSAEGDEHRTIAEIDPADETMVALVLTAGPELNKMLARLDPAKAVEGLIGKGAGLRIGVWDGDGRV